MKITDVPAWIRILIIGCMVVIGNIFLHLVWFGSSPMNVNWFRNKSPMWHFVVFIFNLGLILGEYRILFPKKEATPKR